MWTRRSFLTATAAAFAIGPSTSLGIEPIVDIRRQSGYRGYVALEYEVEADPFVAVPKYLSQLAKEIRR